MAPRSLLMFVSSNWSVIPLWIAAIGLVGLLIRQIVPWKRIASDAEARLRDDLIRRVDKLERAQERERARHEAERRALHHQLGHVTQCFDALLLLIEAAPEKAREHVKKIKEMRARQLVAETEEKAIIKAAEITAFGEQPEEEKP